MSDASRADIVAWRAVPGKDPVRALSGSGGLRGSGRWHSKGRPVVYLASVPSLAMLEVLANVGAQQLLALDYHLMRLTFPATAVDRLTLTELPAGWNAPARSAATMLIGDAWLGAGHNLALQVPSALVPLEVTDTEHNYVLNPLHARRATVTQVLPLPFDARLKASNTAS